jgi:hypothetical protein
VDLRVTQPHRNGAYEAPHILGGVSSASAHHRAQPTVFPDDVPLRGPNALLYALHRFQLAGLPVARWLGLTLLSLAVVWATGILPGRWWGCGFWLLTALAFTVWGARTRRSDFVTFTPASTPAPGLALQPGDKLAVYATGQFSVEGKYQRFTFLPGFYRTFATGEHALLCLARERKWSALASWPPEEPGMWYVFISPTEITALRWGELHFGATCSPAVAIDYRLTFPAGGRRKQDLVRAERLYVAVATQEDGGQLYTDLLHHLPPAVSYASTTKVG